MSEDGFLNEDKAEQNVQDFIEEHGTEGVFVVYFRQFIFRFIMQELKSEDEEVDDIGTQLHLDVTEGDEVLKMKREQMLQRCEDWARDLVDDLKEDEVVAEVIESGDVERLDDEDVEECVEEAIDGKFEEWENQLEKFLEEIE
ncbi:hypothetical protein [Halovenus marina]|uniref:hypothetical protein n=1 Tax=Halovenus marina TaxID=3396621 RepID=UPI003F566589